MISWQKWSNQVDLMKCDSNPLTTMSNPSMIPIPDPSPRENKKTQKENQKMIMDIEIIRLHLSKNFLNMGKRFLDLIPPFRSI
jgi:hypothetical protein